MIRINPSDDDEGYDNDLDFEDFFYVRTSTPKDNPSYSSKNYRNNGRYISHYKSHYFPVYSCIYLGRQEDTGFSQ